MSYWFLNIPLRRLVLSTAWPPVTLDLLMTSIPFQLLPTRQRNFLGNYITLNQSNATVQGSGGLDDCNLCLLLIGFVVRQWKCWAGHISKAFVCIWSWGWASFEHTKRLGTKRELGPQMIPLAYVQLAHCSCFFLHFLKEYTMWQDPWFSSYCLFSQLNLSSPIQGTILHCARMARPVSLHHRWDWRLPMARACS